MDPIQEKNIYPTLDKASMVVDRAWRGTEDFEIVLAYVEASRPDCYAGVGRTEAAAQYCSICEEPIPSYLSSTPDGLWAFPSAIEHVMLYHGVCPIEEFITSAKRWHESPTVLTDRDYIKIDILIDRICMEAENIEDIIGKSPSQHLIAIKSGIANTLSGVALIRNFLSKIYAPVPESEGEMELEEVGEESGAEKRQSQLGEPELGEPEIKKKKIKVHAKKKV